MSKSTGFYPSLSADDRGTCVVSHAGATLLTTAAATVGLDSELSAALGPWKARRAMHDPGKVVLDLAVSIAIGGDALADVATLRAEPEVFGQVASDPTVSRLIDALAADAKSSLAAIDTARATARASAWRLAGTDAPDHGADARRPLVVDIDASLVGAHSEKEAATPTYKKGFGFHPICAFVDHGQSGTGEPLALHLRAGNAGSNTVVDHIAVATAALGQLPGYTRTRRPGRAVLVRADGGGGTHGFIEWLTKRRLSYSVGFTLPGTIADVQERLARIPQAAWYPAIDTDGSGPDAALPPEVRDGAWVAEATGVFDLTGWPTAMRLIVRKERPHPGAQLRITDIDGLRVTAFVTNTTARDVEHTRDAQLTHLELRHRRRARAEDRIRCAKDSGLTNLPLHDVDQNRVWLALVALAGDLVAWAQMLALSGHAARRWEPKRLRHRLFSIAGRIATHSRRRRLHLASTAPWTQLLLAGLRRLTDLACPRAGPAAAPG